MTVLLVCVLLTLGSLFYVFYIPGEIFTGQVKTRLAYLRERKEVVYDNLRDLNFEYKAGKFPESDYNEMKASLEDEAAAILAEISRIELATSTAAASARDRKGARV